MACPTPVDPSFPNGCPAGFPLTMVYYVPNSSTVTATKNTPGAVPMPDPVHVGCSAYACQNANGQNPAQAKSCPTFTPTQIIIALATVGGIIFLPGLWKLASAIPAGLFVLSGLGEAYMPQINSDGSVTCVVATISW